MVSLLKHKVAAVNIMYGVRMRTSASIYVIPRGCYLCYH